MKAVTLILFGLLRERLRGATLAVETESETIGELIAEVFARQELSDIVDWARWLRVARNEEYVPMDALLCEGDELALIPPVSGGKLATRIDVDLTGALLENLSAPVTTDFGAACGSLVTFLGVVRGDMIDDEPTTEIHYEAHEPMALRQMQQLAEDVTGRYGLLGIWIRHRIGVVRVGEAAVRIVIASRHRQEGYDAMTGLMDQFKKLVPIFKKELTPDGKGRWVGLEQKSS